MVNQNLIMFSGASQVQQVFRMRRIEKSLRTVDVDGVTTVLILGHVVTEKERKEAS